MEPTDVLLDFLFDAPPEGAVDYLKSQGYEVAANSDEIINAIKNHAFTVAKVATADKLQKIHDELKKAMDSGTPYKEWLKSVKDTVPGKTNWQTVYRTNMSSAYNSGRYVQQIAAAEYMPFWQHFCPIDSRTRPLGHTLNGLIYRFDDPHWQTMYPPNEYNDRDRIGILSEFAMQQQGLKAESEPPRDKDGKLYEPAKGFSGNPANSTWKPDLTKYSPEIRSELEKALGGKEIKPTEGILKAEKAKKDFFSDEKFRDKVNKEFNNKKNASSEDTAHHLLAENQGFTKKPKVLSEKEINKLNQNDYHTVYRGLVDNKFYDQFKTGEYFSGRGIYGSGTYTAKSIRDASAYTGDFNENQVMKILFPKNAKIIDIDDITKQRDAFFNKDNLRKIAENDNDFDYINKKAKASSKEAAKLESQLDDYIETVVKPKYSALNDVGNFATSKGYDGINVPRMDGDVIEDYIVITNRTKCIVQKEIVDSKIVWD